MPQTPRSSEILVRIYRLLLVAYPASFRREYEQEMISVFRDMAEAAWRRGRRAGLLWLAWCVWWIGKVRKDIASDGEEH